jgi:two-component system sensor histidine kinase RegB
VAEWDPRTTSLVRLRWGAVAGEAFSLLVARYTFRADLPLTPAFALVGLMAATNVALALAVRGRRLRPAESAAVLAFDVLQLTALLALVGGASNPFSILYLVQIGMAALILGPRWTWGLAALAAAAYAALFVLVPAPVMMHDHTGEGFASHLRVMWVAFTAAAALITYFVARLSGELERRESELRAVREQAVRHERVAALTTLAAGAAHELGTPLGTVAVAAGELHRVVERIGGPAADAMRDDLRLIRQELDRCRRILDGMAAGAGELVGEAPATIPASVLLDEVRSTLRPGEVERLDARDACGPDRLVAPRRALAGAVVNLVRNAFDASPGGRVGLSVTPAPDGGVRITVEDAGPGMPTGVLARAGEPFFTTKPPGQGLGLGLFLARSLADRLGGRFEIDSTPGHGTRVSIELPRAGAWSANR